MNEGHAAFLGLERIREIMAEKGLSFAQAAQALWPTNIFTTHTPVPAGNERFGIDLMDKYFRGWSPQLGLDWKAFLALGRERPDDDAEPFCMTVLALKLSAYANGVSELHGHVSREMWKAIWPGLTDRRGADRPRDQRRSSPDLDILHPARGAGPLLRAALRRGADQPGYLGPHRPDQRRRTVADARTPPRAPGRLRPGPAQEADAPDGRLGEGPGAGRRRAVAVRADHQLRAAASRPTSAATCSCPIPTGCCACCPTRTGRCRSFSPARPIPTTCRARKSSRSSSISPAATTWPAASSSSRTTT